MDTPPLPKSDIRSTCSRIAVLLGGDSAERQISLQSGEAVARALQEGNYMVTYVDPAVTPIDSFPWETVDLALVALHGTHGEDGEIQQQLDDLGVCYTGSGPQASRLAFSKFDAKQRFRSAELATPPAHLIPANWSLMQAEERAAQIGFPLAVKPNAQGSSLGVTIVFDPDGFEAALTRARQFDKQVLLEQAIPGEEWTVPVFDNQALPPIRIQTPHPFFDFEAKYEDDATEYNVITDPNDPICHLVQEYAVTAASCLGCQGISRVDLRVDPEGQPWLLEVNTIPGMTDHSLVPKSARAMGWSMLKLCEEMVRSALYKNSIPQIQQNRSTRAA